MSDLPYVSASQVTLFSECRRKWGFRYLERIEQPQHPSAALGERVHGHQLGPYLIDGRSFDFTEPSGEVALAMSPLLPAPQTPGLVVERKFVIPSPSGAFNYIGYIDLFAQDSGVVPGLEGGAALVGDFKTTSNLAFAKTREILATDNQAQLYAMAVMFEDERDVVDLVWFTARTRRPHRAQRAHLRVTGSHVVGEFQRIDEISRELTAIKLAKPKVDELPPNPRMCDQYGGCPHRFRCNLAPPVHAEAINREALLSHANTPSFLDSLKKATGASSLPAASPTQPPPVAAPPAASLPPWTTSPVDPLASRGALGHGIGINPPEAALPPPPPVMNEPVTPTVEATAPKKRGRPAKSAQAPSTSAPAEASVFDVLEGLEELAARMKAAGIKRLRLEGNMEVELV